MNEKNNHLLIFFIFLLIILVCGGTAVQGLFGGLLAQITFSIRIIEQLLKEKL